MIIFRWGKKAGLKLNREVVNLSAQPIGQQILNA